MILEARPPVATVVVGDRLPRHRGRELHREPVLDLRIRPREGDLEEMRRGRVDARDRTDIRVLLVHRLRREPGIRFAPRPEPLAERQETLDVREGLDHRTPDLGIGDARELERDVGRCDLAGARAGAGELEAGIVVEEEIPAQLEAIA